MTQSLAEFLKSQTELLKVMNAEGFVPQLADVAATSPASVGGTFVESCIDIAGDMATLAVAVEAGIIAAKLINDTFKCATGEMEGKEVFKNIGTNAVKGVKRAAITTAGATIGQAIIPIPVVGAAIGGLVFNWLFS